MVEGPGTTRNCIKASKVLNQMVQNIVFSHPSYQEWWKHRRFTQVIKVGKELFLIFSLCDINTNDAQQQQPDNLGQAHDLALRLHFGMVGSLQVNNIGTKPRNTFNNQQPDVPTLEITFESKILRTYQTTISIPINAKAPRTKFTNCSTHDVCNSAFTIRNVLDQLQSPSLHISPDTLISDVLLDQSILPGIGNIIKVEGLHEARIHPKRMLSSMNSNELSTVILACQKYAMKWFTDGRAPWKMVYNQTICGTCKELSVRICRVGGTNRTTFWCSRCQPMNPNVQVHSISNTIINTPTSMSTSMSASANGQITTTSKSNGTNELATNIPKKICPNHGPKKVILRRCKKNGVNEHRIFYTCQERGCNYFCWADTNFPSCKCGKRAVLRVSKTDKTGGKWFFFCARRGMKVTGCGYFLWAEKKYLDRYGQLLTPLL